MKLRKLQCKLLCAIIALGAEEVVGRGRGHDHELHLESFVHDRPCAHIARCSKTLAALKTA